MHPKKVRRKKSNIEISLYEETSYEDSETKYIELGTSWHLTDAYISRSTVYVPSILSTW